MPPQGRDVQHLPFLQHTLRKSSFGKFGKLPNVRVFHVHLAAVGGQAVKRIQHGSAIGMEQPNELGTHDLLVNQR